MPVVTAPSPDGLDDIALARRIAAGDTEAMQWLMRRCNQALFRAARSILKDDGEAEEVVQDAYLKAFRGIDAYRGDARLSTWLTRIAVNEALARARKQRRRAEIVPLAGPYPGSEPPREFAMQRHATEAPEHAALRAEVRRLIESRIDDLPDAFRSVFVLRALEDMSVEETAACLGVPEATVRTRYFRARSLLREALAREVDFNLESAFGCAGPRCDRIVAGVLATLREPGRGPG